MKIKIEKLMYANDTKYTISIFVYRRSAVIDDIVICAILLYQNNCQDFFIDYKIHNIIRQTFLIFHFMSAEKNISNLQIIITNLAQQAEGHFIQSKVFGAKGFSKLAEKYKEHTEEERGYVEKCIDRVIDLGGKVKLEDKKGVEIFENPVDFVKYDLQVSKDGLALLKTMIDDAKDDLTTFDLLKDYYKDEEEDMYWGEQQLELIEMIGLQNWLIKQM